MWQVLAMPGRCALESHLRREVRGSRILLASCSASRFEPQHLAYDSIILAGVDGVLSVAVHKSGKEPCATQVVPAADSLVGLFVRIERRQLRESERGTATCRP